MEIIGIDRAYSDSDVEYYCSVSEFDGWGFRPPDSEFLRSDPVSRVAISEPTPETEASYRGRAQ